MDDPYTSGCGVASVSLPHPRVLYLCALLAYVRFAWPGNNLLAIQWLIRVRAMAGIDDATPLSPKEYAASCSQLCVGLVLVVVKNS